MNQQQLEAWIAQNGGPAAVQFATKTVTVKNPAKILTLADGTDNPDYNPDTAVPATISMQVLSWTNPKTGASISVRPSGQDSYEVVEQTGTKPANADPGAAAQDANEVELQRQREANNALPADQDPSYETDAQRRARGRQTALDQGAAAEKQATQARQAEQDKRQAEQDRAAAEARNRPQVSYKKVGTKTYKVLTYPDGRPDEVSESALPPDITDDQITTVNGQPARVVRDANGKATGLEVLPVSGQGTNPTFTGSPPPWVPQAVRDDLTGYSKQLQDAVASGAITPARATQLMSDRYKSAQAAVDNQLDAAKTVYGAGVTERGQDVTTANARLNYAQNAQAEALRTSTSINDWVNPGSDAGWNLYQSLRQQAYADAQRYGGLDKLPHTPVPAAIQSAANSITITQPDGTTVTVPHGGGAAGPSPAAPPAPAMAPVQPSPDLPSPTAGLMDRAGPTGFAAVDQISNQIEQGGQLTFSGMEDTFRRAGMDEDAIAASRQNFLGAA